MPERSPTRLIVAAALLALAAAAPSGCENYVYTEPGYAVALAPGAVASALKVDPTLAKSILALDADRLSEADVRNVLARGPAPRVIALQGSSAFVTMEPFTRFLVAMGYPEGKVRNPRNGGWSWDSYTSTSELAGRIAWFYETEAMPPILMGHSQGGMRVMEILHALSGATADRIEVVNGRTGRDLGRYDILDPLTGKRRPAVGLRLDFAAAIATGRMMRVFLGQWGTIDRLRSVPDSVSDFAGLTLTDDLLGNAFRGSADEDRYAAVRSASVRNVTLPAGYDHLSVMRVAHLADQPAMVHWLYQYRPGNPTPRHPEVSEGDADNILLAAEIWYSIRRHWCLAAQRLIRVQMKEEGAVPTR